MRPLVTFLLLLCFAACDQPGCPAVQENKVLSTHKPTDSMYQQELTRLLLADSFKADYYFNERIEKNNRTYLSVNAYGGNYCGTLHVLLQQEDEQSNKLQNNAGWSGAGLSGLKLTTVLIDSNIQPVYAGLDYIVD